MMLTERPYEEENENRNTYSCLSRRRSQWGGGIEDTGMFVWGMNTRTHIESYRKRKRLILN